MVDKIIEYQSHKSIRGIKTVSFEEYQLKSRFDNEPGLPESLMMESLFQLGNWLIMLSSDFTQMGMLVRINEAQFHKQLSPGENMLMEVQIQSYRDDGILFNGSAKANENIILSGNGCLATPVELAEYYNPDDLKVLFSEIYHPQVITKDS